MRMTLSTGLFGLALFLSNNAEATATKAVTKVVKPVDPNTPTQLWSPLERFTHQMHQRGLEVIETQRGNKITLVARQPEGAKQSSPRTFRGTIRLNANGSVARGRDGRAMIEIK